MLEVYFKLRNHVVGAIIEIVDANTYKRQQPERGTTRLLNDRISVGFIRDNAIENSSRPIYERLI